MSNTSDPDLTKITEIFLVPSSFLVAALGTADTNLHRAGVSLMGLVIALLWWVCSHESLKERQPSDPEGGALRHSRRVRILSWLPLFFSLFWLLSLVAHLLLWNKPLGTL
jgi:hypothetical protein